MQEVALRFLSSDDVVRLQRWELERERALDLLQRAPWDESQHPRDESGKFTSGGGGGGAGSEPLRLGEAEKPGVQITSKPSKGPEHAKAMLSAAQEVARKEGVDPNLITIGDQNDALCMVNGKVMWTQAAVIGGKRIEVYPDQLSDETVAGAMSHEINHLKWISASDKYKAGDADAVASMDSAFLNYPTQAFGDVDGVSPYSELYWDKFEKQPGEDTYELAVMETLAEMARIREKEGQWPQRWAVKPELTAEEKKAGAERWKTLYETVDRLNRGESAKSIVRWLARAGWDESQHPRDEGGRFTSGGGGGGGTNPAPSGLSGPERLAQSLERIKGIRTGVEKAAGKADYPKDGIVLSDGEHKFTLNGKEYSAAGLYDPEAARRGEPAITIFVNETTPASVGATVIHEITHDKWRSALDKYEAERVAIKDRGNEEGFASVFDQNGKLQPAYAEQYPTYASLYDTFFNVKKSDFANTDGVSPYSQEYWNSWEKDQTDTKYRLAVNETLAEMAQERATGGFTMFRPQTDLSAAEREAGVQRWNNLFNAVNTAYKTPSVAAAAKAAKLRGQRWEVERERVLVWLARAGWDESQHPRDEAGRFTSGGAGGSGETTSPAATIVHTPTAMPRLEGRLRGSNPTVERVLAWDKQIGDRQSELEKQGQLGGDEDSNLQRMSTAMGVYLRMKNGVIQSEGRGFNFIYSHEDLDQEAKIEAVAETRYNAEKRVAEISSAGAVSTEAYIAVVQDASMRVLSEGAKRVETYLFIDDEQSVKVYEACGFRRGEEGAGVVTMYYGEATTPEEIEVERRRDEERKLRNLNMIRDTVETVSGDMDFDPDKISLGDNDDPHVNFTLNGKDYKAAGVAYTVSPYPAMQGTIKLFPQQIWGENSAKEVVAHEIKHIQFQKALDGYETERKALIRDPAFVTGGDEAVRDKSGALKPEYATKYPIFNMVEQALQKYPYEDFADTDGVSSYSKEWWKKYQGDRSTVNFRSAVHETLAEMAARKYTSGNFPEHWGAGFPEPGEPQPAPLTYAQMENGTKRWRNLYSTVQKIWGMPA